MKKRFIVVTALLIVMSIISGCGVNYASKKDIEDMNAFELIHEMTQGDPYQPIEVDYENMRRDEYSIRSVIEASSIYLKYYDRDHVEEEKYVKKYGINNYWKENIWISFDNLEDMKTVISNRQFQDDYFLLFGIHFKPDAYYLPVSLGIESDDIDIYMRWMIAITSVLLAVRLKVALITLLYGACLIRHRISMQEKRHNSMQIYAMQN